MFILQPGKVKAKYFREIVHKKKRAQDVEYFVVEEVSMAGIRHRETLLDVRAGTCNGPG